ncbi:MAG: hypothetical protein H6822_00090 [Planctomycetaceae bacterium]|nr:hypothetical protein [Planctomycetales bacterium]MCB9920544.1 hypothetical protein [Planctomycetaceae bacterium]
MNPPRRNIGPTFTVAIVVIVAATSLAQNLRTRGPFHLREATQSEIWDADILRRGWPFPYYERVDVSVTFRAMFGPETQKLLPTIKRPAMDWRNLQSWAIVGDVALGILMLVTTTIITEYWRRHRTGPFQFGLRTLLIATAIVAVIVAFIDNNFMHISALLYPPLAFGLLSSPAVIGLLLQHCARRSDRRLSELRSRYSGHEELVQSTPMETENTG